ncbi:hypothetical protein [Halalkalicoccus salilacus]|uniref:hypothetical protein n=1 Tax=Halalkalicoccus salilacus TaxID=3117459 RepID=UPI00300EB920
MSRPETTDAPGPSGRKAVLFCPDCERSSPVEGDWIVRERTRSVELRCPDCGTYLTERNHDRGLERPTTLLVRLWSAWVRAATAWLRSVRRTRV